MPMTTFRSPVGPVRVTESDVSLLPQNYRHMSPERIYSGRITTVEPVADFERSDTPNR